MITKIKIYTPSGVIILTKTTEGVSISTKSNAKNSAFKLEMYKKEIEQAKKMMRGELP